MRKYLWVIAFLIFVPRAKADTFVATSGFVGLSGNLGGVITLSGVAPSGAPFTATGGLGLVQCDTEFNAGDPIFPCGNAGRFEYDYYSGVLTVTVNGASSTYVIGPFESYSLPFSGAPMYLSGATQATLSEPSGTEFIACGPQDQPFIACVTGGPPPPSTLFVLAGPPWEYTVNLVADGMGGYIATSQFLSTPTPEPGTEVLLLSGVGLLFGLMMRKRWFNPSPSPLSASFLQLQHESRQRWLAHICCRGDHVPRRLPEFSQLFVGHFPEPLSRFINVQGR
jgi:hypothetical protein